MMRVAGRGTDGKAKPLNLTDNGEIKSTPASKILLSEISGSRDGRVVSGESSWTSDVFSSDGYSNLVVHARSGGGFQYSVRINEVMYNDDRLQSLTGRSTRANEQSEENKWTEMRIPYNFFRIEIMNHGTEDKPLALYAYLNNKNKYLNIELEKKMDEQHNEMMDMLTRQVESKILLSEFLGSRDGREVSGGSSWSSDVFSSEDYSNLVVHARFGGGFKYSVRINEVMFNDDGLESPTGRAIWAIERSEQNEWSEMKTPYNFFRIEIINHGTEDQPFALYAYLNNKTTYLDNEIIHMTNKNHDELVRLLEKSPSEEIKVPTLTNVQYITNTTSIRNVNFFFDGLFYGSSIGSKLYTSKDCIEWVELYDFENDEEIAWVIVSDTHRIIVGFKNGDVYISNEEGVFKPTPDIQTGKLDIRFGQTKHNNVILFSTYENKGNFDTKKHEVWLSRNNGESFSKIFDNDTPDSFKPITNKDNYHLHNVEFDHLSGRIYLYNGDFDQTLLQYSDDWGKTWHAVGERDDMLNVTQLISIHDGLVLGADHSGGGIDFIRLDRNKTALDIPKITNYIEHYWRLSDKNHGYIATRRWIDREQGIYLMGFTPEHNDEASGFIIYSENGLDWVVIQKSISNGNYKGFENVVYGNGIVASSHISNNGYRQIFRGELN